MAFSQSSRSRRLATPGMASALALFLPLLLLSSSPSAFAVASTEADAAILDAASPVEAEGGTAGAPGFLKNWISSILAEDGDSSGEHEAMYEPDFGIFDRGILGRAPPGVTALANNVPEQLNVEPNSIQIFMLEKSVVARRHEDDDDDAHHEELRKRSEAGDFEGQNGYEDEDGSTEVRLEKRARNATRTVYFSANTCIQPQVLSETITAQAPQLTMYLSTSYDSTTPGPTSNSSNQTVHAFTEGAVMVTLNTTQDIYIGIYAPNMSTTTLSGTYNFQVAASTDECYHSFDNQTDANLIWVDSDASSSLLITHNLTDSTDADTLTSIMSTPPYVMFAQNAEDRSVNGVRLSYCGLQNYAQIAATNNGKFTSMVVTGMTRAGQGNLPKQQFYFSGLNSSSNYAGILAALPANGTGIIGQNVAGGGGKLSRATSFTTKGANVNCEVVYNLTFCNETAYAVPSNPTRFTDATELARVYDDYASNMFSLFKNALAQIPCEAPDTQRYSLARGCADCEAAYKNWLCSVAIPRCADFNDNSTYLQPRAIGQPFPDGTFLNPSIASQYPNTSAYNASRNAFIDETIAPGPYKEVLPCDDLCYGLVQSCPSDIGFTCPLPRHIGFNTSYGQRTEADQNGFVTCNYPGSAHYFSAGPTGPRWSIVAVFAATMGSLTVWLL
ncbi:calcium influx-promoting protein ehs1 [Ophiostoma piceae UAMH 11346]|uniref:Calcium influx-promoting protein ehs1 n=1 Tax=Ophiostoma piceae (strain UAMH 11346) TaxID=1262450 RepID=S3D8G4_OPHP1|nr:calcium influx-promoting protein ehs1 [Ophiostoma piceae UAMH 11346]